MSGSETKPDKLHAALQARMERGARVDDPAGLAAMAALDRALGYPGRGAYVVQVLGTNGKGSTSSMLAHALGGGDLKVGLFTSPHLFRVHERLRLDGVPIDDELLYAVIDRIARQEEELGLKLTFFELLTMAALVWFEQAKAQVIVLEAGLGGRLDSTRVRLSQLTVMTPVALDHQDILGHSLAAIASEKSAVFHAGAKVISAEQAPQVWTVFQDMARKAQTSLERVQALPDTPTRSGYQQQNAALALRAAHLVGLALHQPLTNIEDRVAQFQMPGRFEKVPGPGKGGVIYDVAHNPHAMRATLERLLQSGQRIAQIFFYCAIDKDRSQLLTQLQTVGAPIVHVALDPGQEGESPANAKAQLASLQAAGHWCLVIGSHRLVGALGRGCGADGLVDPVARRPFEAGSKGVDLDPS